MPIPDEIATNEVRPPLVDTGETKDAYVTRCMIDPQMQSFDPNNRQAVCEKVWTSGQSTEVVQPVKKGIDGKKETRRANLIVNSDSNLLRTETMDGRDYLVAPVVPIVEGVHNGEFMPYEEIVMFPDAWNGRPLPIDHPRLRDGEPATANDPAIFESSVIGFLFNVKDRPDIRGISGELWIDTEKAKTVVGGKEVVEKLESGDGLEVSTGYFTFIDKIPGVWNNPKSGEREKFTSSQYGVRPDHLALLPFALGACSIADGCGAPRVNNDHTVNLKSQEIPVATDQTKIKVLDSARRPSFKDTESTSWASVNKSFAAFAKECSGGESSVKDASAAAKKCIASKTLLGDPSADNDRDLIFFPVVNPITNKLNEGALRAVISGRGVQAGISANAKASAQEMARKLLKSEFGVDLEDDEKKAQVQNALHLAEQFEKSLTLNAEGLVVNGKQLGKHLQAALDVHTNEGGTNEMMARCAQAAGISSETMQGIVSGTHDNIPKHWLNTFAAVMDIDPYDLYSASSNDSYDRRKDTEGYGRAYSAKDGVAQSHNDGSESDCGCKNQKKLVQDAVKETLREEKAMADKKTTVDGLIINGSTQFDESHREWLMTLSDQQLAVLAPKSKPDDADEDDAALAANAKTAPAPLTKEAVMQVLGLTPEAITAMNAAADEKKAQRESMIAEIVTNSQGSYTKEDLAEMSDRLLAKTYEAVQPQTYRVAAGARLNAADAAIPKTPSIFLTAPGKEIGRAN